MKNEKTRRFGVTKEIWNIPNEEGKYIKSYLLLFKSIKIWKIFSENKNNEYDKPGYNIALYFKSKMFFEIKLFYRRMIYRDDNTEYLYRTNLFECSWFSIKIHKIIASDDQCQHDHPWPFISFILKNGYIEHTPVYDENKNIRNGYSFAKRFKPLSIIYRPAKWIHSLEIEKDKPATTFVITFKRYRKWGFWTKQGWIHWKLYKSSEHC